ncbi:MAG: hypothetical protein IJR49_03935 [Treponema sp.]|nr:hypothetical protein [Treponema sp.]
MQKSKSPIDLSVFLKQNSYPGRGIIVGLTPNARHAVIAYFIMGRSELSRQRVFVANSNDIVIHALEKNHSEGYPNSSTNKAVLSSSKTALSTTLSAQDKSLIIYSPIRTFLTKHSALVSDMPSECSDILNTSVIANGDHADTIIDFLQVGKTFEEALQTRTYEPDYPHYTPRISAVLFVKQDACKYTLSILKKSYTENYDEQTYKEQSSVVQSANAQFTNSQSDCERNFFYYENALAGFGHFIHTYSNSLSSTVLKSFSGSPHIVVTHNDIDEFTNTLWQNLNSENKVALFVRYISLVDGSFSSKIINKWCKA